MPVTVLCSTLHLSLLRERALQGPHPDPLGLHQLGRSGDPDDPDQLRGFLLQLPERVLPVQHFGIERVDGELGCEEGEEDRTVRGGSGPGQSYPPRSPIYIMQFTYFEDVFKYFNAAK